MAKIPANLRRNPQAGHVKAWGEYRLRKGRPKAVVKPGRKLPLTFERYEQLMEAYGRKISAQAERLDRKSERHLRMLLSLLGTAKTIEELEGIERMIKLTHRDALGSVVGHVVTNFEITEEIITDFGRTRGLKVFGFGVGFAPTLFFLRNFMRAKTRGIDIGYFSKELTKDKRLGVIHGADATNPEIRKIGKFDVTYSIGFLDPQVLEKEDALKALANAAAMTRKGGKSYHIVYLSNDISKRDIEKLGFKIDKWEENGLIKLTKIRD